MPGFKFNLLSVSKITKELSCSVIFYPKFCTFQDLYSGKVMGIGREHEGLYWLQEDNVVEAEGVAIEATCCIVVSPDCCSWSYSI